MYVPPDEAIHSYGEVGLRLQGDGLVDVQHTSHGPGVAAAVNPVYDRSVTQARLCRSGRHPGSGTLVLVLVWYVAGAKFGYRRDGRGVRTAQECLCRGEKMCRLTM